jgi:molybdopterin molybdotransferase
MGLCAALGAPCTRAHARDERGALEAALARAAASADVVVTTGGVSMGDKDLVPGVAARLGFEVVLHQVAIQPGKPVFVARRADGVLFLGLPGNPVSVLATAHLFLVPALDRCSGQSATRWLTLTMGESFRHDGQRHLFLPASVIDGQVHPIRWNGSGDLFAAAAGDGLLDLPVGASFERGAPARLLPYVGHRLGERGALPPRGAR